MGYMKDLYIRLQNGDEISDVEKAFVNHQTIIDQEWNEYYDRYIMDEVEKVGRIG